MRAQAWRGRQDAVGDRGQPRRDPVLHRRGLSLRVIAGVMGWAEEYVEKILRRYVGRNAATNRAAQPRRQGRRVNKTCKTDCKTVAQSTANYLSGRRESNPRMQLGKLPFYH
jgi:hypothetical protein